jgi:hypothetical protein
MKVLHGNRLCLTNSVKIEAKVVKIKLRTSQ